MSMHNFLIKAIGIPKVALQPWKLVRGPWEVIYRQCTLPGSGAGRGGGAGGSIKEAGGGLGRFGAAQEESYFYNQEKEKLSKLKKQLKDDPKLQLEDKKDDK